MAERSCMSCRFHDSQRLVAEMKTVDICRYAPPAVHVNLVPTQGDRVELRNQTLWPVVESTDWCGRYEPQLEG